MDHRSLYEQVVEELGQRIISGHYRPGVALPNEDVLCAEFDVSRTVIREATKVLTAKGLILPLRKVGTIVQSRHNWNLLDKSVQNWEYSVGQRERLLRNVTEVRRIIEPEACRLAAVRARDSEIAEIENAYQDMEHAVEDHPAYVLADERFHMAILMACNNELLIQLAATLREAIKESYRTSAQTPGGLKNALPPHRAILDAIQQHKSDLAYTRMQHLIDIAWHDIVRILGTQEGA